MSLLSVEHVSLLPILNDITFSMDAHERIGVVGKSGSGKTSLFRLINRLQSQHFGSIFFQGADTQTLEVTSLRQKIGYVYQKAHLFGLTVEENLFYPYHLKNTPPNLDEIAHYLCAVDLDISILKKEIQSFSGGEQQRIAFVRSLLNKPSLLLLDEVTASLDDATTLRVEALIRLLNEENHVGVLFISHSFEQTKRLAHKILHLHEGEVAFFGSSEEYFSNYGNRYE